MELTLETTYFGIPAMEISKSQLKIKYFDVCRIYMVQKSG